MKEITPTVGSDYLVTGNSAGCQAIKYADSIDPTRSLKSWVEAFSSKFLECNDTEMYLTIMCRRELIRVASFEAHIQQPANCSFLTGNILEYIMENNL